MIPREAAMNQILKDVADKLRATAEKLDAQAALENADRQLVERIARQELLPMTYILKDMAYSLEQKRGIPS
jgi:cell division protein FtsB